MLFVAIAFSLIGTINALLSIEIALSPYRAGNQLFRYSGKDYASNA